MHAETTTYNETNIANIQELNISDDLKRFLVYKEAKVETVESEGEYNYDTGEYDVRSETVVRFKHNQELPFDLPEGYCYMGGTARGVVLAELGNRILPPRDTDIVAIEDLHPDKSLIEELSEKYMPDDTKYGYPIDIKNAEAYFNSRDFVFNQILVHGEEVIITPAALENLNDKIVRPTDFETQNQRVTPKLVMKALRMQVELVEMYGKGEIQGINDWEFSSGNIPMMMLAINLNKAFARGDTMAFVFFQKLIEYGTVSRRDEDPNAIYNANSPGELAVSLRWKINDSRKNPFMFANPELNAYRSVKEYTTRHYRFSPDDDYAHCVDLADQYYSKVYGVKHRKFSKDEEPKVISDSSDDIDVAYDALHEMTSSEEEQPNSMKIAFMEALAKAKAKDTNEITKSIETIVSDNTDDADVFLLDSRALKKIKELDTSRKI